MKKRTAALSLVLIGPTLIAGCASRTTTARNDDCDPDTEDCEVGRNGYYRGARRYVPHSSGGTVSSTDSGGFGSTGRSYFRSS